MQHDCLEFLNASYTPYHAVGNLAVQLQEAGFRHLEEYSDGTTERGKALRKAICDKLHFASLEFQTLEGVVKAIGLPECELCTYCWNGKE